MAREIKFRAWSGGKMWQPFTLIEELNRQDEGLYPKDAVFLQYTGLKDKNGKEIYEGDICKQVFNRKTEQGEVVIESTRGAVVGGYPIWQHDIEIIGNIYENPELLKKGV